MASRGVRPADTTFDPHAALAEVRAGGLAFGVRASARPVRALAQRLLGGPAELDAPRPLTAAEHAIWALALAAAIEDLGAAAEVWPLAAPGPGPGPDGRWLELAVALPGGAAMTVLVELPAALAVRPPPARPPPPGWAFDLPVVVARSAILADDAAALAVRDVIAVEGALELEIGEGAVGLRARPGAVEAEVATGYLRRDMALPDDAHLELSVQLGTTRLSLRQLGELAAGQVIPLGRPLAGPFEVRAAGRLIARGELIDLEGELGVRIVSLEE